MTAFTRHVRDRLRKPGRPATGRRLGVATTAVIGVLLLPGLAAAHPLGNFTINHYTGVRIEPDRILLDVVIDQAEIPAFQARLTFDLDGDGELSGAETDAGRVAACEGLAASLDLRVNYVPQALELTEAGLTFPPGVGGLSTMRSVCGFEVALATPLQAGGQVTFADGSFPERLGWREIVVQGSGVTLAAAGGDALRTSSPSKRLTDYPTNLLTQALADSQVALVASPSGPVLPALDIPDADAVARSGEVAPTSGAAVAGAQEGAAGATVPQEVPAAVVPGGVGADELPTIFRTADLTPIVLLLSVLTAAALGAGHALTPGHGKTLMAAYLVGSRGTPAHAAGLGLSVALSHTLGILALASLVVGAQGLLPADVVVRTAPVVAAVSIVAIGAWMLLGEARRRWQARDESAEGAHDHGHSHDHEHGDGHDDESAHDPATAHDQDHRAAHRHDLEQTHGGRTHSHLPSPGSTISWRSLFVLGLAGGLIPSASALLILLGSIAAGRPAFGFVLVVAFGLGMALVMGGIGLAMVIARGRLDRVDASTTIGRARGYLPLVASFLVLGFGLYLTVQAIAGNTVL